MARKITKSQRKKMEKFAKKHPFLTFVSFLLVVAIVGVYLHWSRTFTIPFLVGVVPQKTEETIYTDGELQFHFIELGNANTGDCTLVKVGDTEILIDAGSKKNSAKAIVPYIKNLCADNTLEYVIATHAHQDHIAGFVGLSDYDGIFESFDCEIIIDYPRSNSTSDIRADYEELRDAEVANGATHYTALECWNNENGAKRSYELAEGISMNILYHKYYEQKASTENDYSVCLLFTQGNNHYLFTGDLESGGESSLVDENNLPKCKLYKAGHHGSQTSSSTKLMQVVQPEVVCVSCCCGNMEYADDPLNDFPSQAFVDRVSPYTEQIYVTTIVSNNALGYESMNGNIVVTSKGGELTVTCSNNNTLFKDTDWFKNNRTWTGGR